MIENELISMDKMRAELHKMILRLQYSQETTRTRERELEKLRVANALLRADAERWRMVMIVNTEVMIPPETRTHQAEVSAYMAAVANGMGIEAAIDAAIACQHEIAI